MLLIILVNDWFTKKGYMDKLTESGIQFWNQLYIPIVVAMAATQNVKVAVSSGMIAIVAGIVPVLLCGATIPLLAKLTKPKAIGQHGNYHPVS